MVSGMIVGRLLGVVFCGRAPEVPAVVGSPQILVSEGHCSNSICCPSRFHCNWDCNCSCIAEEVEGLCAGLADLHMAFELDKEDFGCNLKVNKNRIFTNANILKD